MDWNDDFYDDEVMFFGPDGMPVDRYGRPMGFRRAYGPVDLEGRPVQRTKQSHPYSYDGHVVLRARGNAKEMECVYTDRMWEWDHGKMKRLCEEHMKGFRWDNVPAEKVEALLRAWEDDPGLVLVAVMEWCNQATGYPTWSLHYVFSKKKRDEMAEASRQRALKEGCFDWRCERSGKPFEEGFEPVLVEGRGFPRYYCPGCVPAENPERS